ncbi:hypothetical protein [Eubacterium sp. 1001713B170207_170306_E7]|uniref:hypothetical protein n=1 Tax=Eubacterium sp. 1001713B170207_170306_E7 TaxID=2787097 RepID=UPI0018976A2D|nr:hypothetical protein [Eubacterium sp. 1001713B170207_170306_E7]
MKQRFRSSGFFVELIITIVFFAVACCIIVQLFAKAGLVSSEALDRRSAAAQCQTLCETIKGTGSLDSVLKDGCYEKTSSGVRVYYDRDWQMTPEATAVYSIAVDTETEAQAAGSLERLRFEAFKGSGSLYVMSAARYFEAGEVQ